MLSVTSLIGGNANVETKLSNGPVNQLFYLSLQNCLVANQSCSRNVCGKNACGKDVYSKDANVKIPDMIFTFPRFTYPRSPNPFPQSSLFSTMYHPSLMWQSGPLNVSLGFSFLFYEAPVHIKILTSNEICMFFFCQFVFQQFNLQSPVSEPNKVEEKFFLPYSSFIQIFVGYQGPSYLRI